MKTGGKAMLSISVLSDSDSIQRKTSAAGETTTTTDRKNPMRPRRPRHPARPTGPLSPPNAMAIGSRPLRALPHVEEEEAEGEDDDEEDHHHRRGIADVIEGEGLSVEIEV